MMANRKIVVRLIGGLGNQLFQMQYAINLREKLGGIIQIDDSFFSSSSKPHERLAVNNLEYPFEIIRLGWLDLKVKRSIERVFYKLRLAVPKFFNPAYLFENTNLNPEDMPRIIIDGFWQDSKNLYEPFTQQIRQKIFKNDVNTNPSSANKVCVHIRRGDYLTKKNLWGQNQLSIISLRYYYEAFQYFKKKLDEPVFEIYTDDELWATKIFESISNISIVKTKEFHPLELLAKMAGYDNFIIANSTLSWWAAVLSRKIDKIVILPRKWAANMDSEKYRLPYWIPIEN